jgi:hypothetical protein
MSVANIASAAKEAYKVAGPAAKAASQFASVAGPAAAKAASQFASVAGPAAAKAASQFASVAGPAAEQLKVAASKLAPTTIPVATTAPAQPNAPAVPVQPDPNAPAQPNAPVPAAPVVSDPNAVTAQPDPNAPAVPVQPDPNAPAVPAAPVVSDPNAPAQPDPNADEELSFMEQITKDAKAGKFTKLAQSLKESLPSLPPFPAAAVLDVVGTLTDLFKQNIPKVSDYANAVVKLEIAKKQHQLELNDAFAEKATGPALDEHMGEYVKTVLSRP